MTKKPAPLSIMVLGIAVFFMVTASIWHIGESLNRERQQAFVKTQGERIKQYMAQQHANQQPRVIIFGNSLLRNALPDQSSGSSPTWLRIVYFDPLYFVALYPILENDPPDALIIQDALFLPLRFGDGQSPMRRLQRHMREIRPLLKRYLADNKQRQQQLEEHMQATQEAVVPCIQKEETIALRNMQRKAKTHYRRQSVSALVVTRTHELIQHIPAPVLLRIPRAPVIEDTFGEDLRNWHGRTQQLLAATKPVQSLTLSEAQPAGCYCDHAHIELSCRQPLTQFMTEFIQTVRDAS